MLINRLNDKWQRILFLIVWLIVIISSIMQGVVIMVENALGARVPEVFMKISFANILILLMFGWLYYMIQSIWLGIIFMVSAVIGVFYWVLHSVFKMMWSFTEGLIDFVILAVPAFLVLCLLVEFIFVGPRLESHSTAKQ